MDNTEWTDGLKRDMAKIAEMARIIGERYAEAFQQLGKAACDIKITLPWKDEQ